MLISQKLARISPRIAVEAVVLGICSSANEGLMHSLMLHDEDVTAVKSNDRPRVSATG